MILEVFSNLNDSMFLFYFILCYSILSITVYFSFYGNILEGLLWVICPSAKGWE